MAGGVEDYSEVGAVLRAGEGAAEGVGEVDGFGQGGLAGFLGVLGA
ncbi:hypothetical protein EV648_104101 [Kribbella sp. VKM Ac-2568]|nr:hypothetical protein EV648_104101 [Kribbella sp. VKM Ac-2568]